MVARESENGKELNKKGKNKKMTAIKPEPTVRFFGAFGGSP